MKGMVVCPEPLAARAGELVLRAGGNAFDAAVAAAFAQGVTNPLLCGLAGTFVGLCGTADGRRDVVNAEAEIGSVPPPATWVDELAGRAETIGRYALTSEANQIGAPSVMIPGFVAGAAAIFDDYGSGAVTWSDVVSPALELARKGFRMYPYIAGFWKSATAGDGGPGGAGYPSLAEKIRRETSGLRLIMKDENTTFAVGDLLVQGALADTLQRLADAGARDFYEGQLAQRICDDLEPAGALFTRDDLAGYRARILPPVTAQVWGHDLFTTSPPTPGVQLIEILQLLDRLGGIEDRDAATTIDRFAKVLRATFMDNAYLKALRIEDGDDHVARVLGEDNLSQWHQRIAGGDRITVPAHEPVDGTTHVTVIDEQSNVATITHSIGSIAGSARMTEGLGFLHNNFLGHFDPRPGREASIEPGRRIGSGLPTAVYRDGELLMAIGAPGGSRIITSVAQVVVDMLLRGTGADTAVALPRFHSEERSWIQLEPSIPETVADELARMGNEISRSTYMSRVQAVERTPNGRLIAGADPRGGAGVGHA